MTDAKFSDIDKKVYRKDECYQIQVTNLADNTHLEFDIAKEQNSEKIVDAMKLAIQNGKKWYKITKKDNKWAREEIVSPN